MTHINQWVSLEFNYYYKITIGVLGYNIPKNDRYSDSSTDWTLVSLNFTVEIFGNKLIYDQIDTAHADMCFSSNTITHSVS